MRRDPVTTRCLLCAGALVLWPVLPAVAQPAAAAPPASAASASAAAAVTESVDPARAAAVEKAARAIGDRNERVAKVGGQPPSAILVRGQTEAGVAYLSGGVTVDDRKTMHAERAGYSLWVATVAKRSGAYLSDVRLSVTRAGDKAPAIARTMDGPWLLAALPPGRYEIVATMPADGADKEQTLKMQVQLAKGGLRQAVLRFDSSSELSPDGSDPFKGNPFGAAPVTKKK
jgi:hypothetical protein